MSDNAGDVEFARRLSEVNYPCSRDDLIAAVRTMPPNPSVLARLDAVPDRVYEGLTRC